MLPELSEEDSGDSRKLALPSLPRTENTLGEMSREAHQRTKETSTRILLLN